MGEVHYKIQNVCEFSGHMKDFKPNSNISPSLYKGLVHKKKKNYVTEMD